MSIIILTSCKKTDDQIEDKLLGSWVLSEVNDSIITYNKVNSLYDNSAGFTFNAGQELIVRDIEGWCATPPVTYSNFEGKWSLSDSLIYIRTVRYDIFSDSQLKIVSLDRNYLSVIMKSIKE